MRFPIAEIVEYAEQLLGLHVSPANLFFSQMAVRAVAC
jgi:hypothetical protein